MTSPLQLTVWEPPGYLPQTPRPGVVNVCCRRHGPPERLPEHELVLGYLILRTFLARSELHTAAALQAAAGIGPLCCHLGDETMERLHRQIPAVWALRN